MNSSDTPSAQAPIAAYPFLAADEEVSLLELSHVFYCMQYYLQFQVDIAIISRNGLHDRDPRVVHVRLDPYTKLEQEA